MPEASVDEEGNPGRRPREIGCSGNGPMPAPAQQASQA
jgi:hypothetical protein